MRKPVVNITHLDDGTGTYNVFALLREVKNQTRKSMKSGEFEDLYDQVVKLDYNGVIRLLEDRFDLVR